MNKNFETLEVGRTYLSRVGDEVAIEMHVSNLAYPYRDTGDVGYLPCGAWHTGYHESGSDLVELLPIADDAHETIADESILSEKRTPIADKPYYDDGVIGKAELAEGEAADRKATPIYSGVLMYFPDAIAEVARCSHVGNNQHNPGTELHWDRDKSGDELDALTRHLMDAGKIDSDGIRHSTKIAWRALGNLQKEIEREQQDANSESKSD